MNYFSYWADQIAPYAEAADSTLTLIFWIAIALYWIIVLSRPKNRSPFDIDWAKIPLSVVMLVYTFQYTFVPGADTFIGGIVVFFLIMTSIVWVINHHLRDHTLKLAAEQEKEQKENEQNQKTDQK